MDGGSGRPPIVLSFCTNLNDFIYFNYNLGRWVCTFSFCKPILEI